MSWDASSDWYNGCVGEGGHYYHDSVVLDGAVRLLNLKPKESLLDIGCGQGVLKRKLSHAIEYVGLDSSQKLLDNAKKMSSGQFLLADATKPLPVEKKDFDAACFILSLQNMEFPEKAIHHAANHLKPGGRLLLVINHPCFRIPRQSNWGVDEKMKLQYRRMNVYMTPQSIPIQTNPSQGDASSTTYSYHHPLSHYTSFLLKNHLLIQNLEEWCSDKTSTGAKARMENRARSEFPFFLALLAIKNLH